MKTVAAVLVLLLLFPSAARAGNTHSAEFTSTANKNLTAADSTTLSVTGALTIQAAFKFTGTTADSQGLITKYGSAGNRTFSIERASAAGSGVGSDENKIIFTVSGNGTTLVSVKSATQLVNNTWYCTVFTYVPSTSITIYLDAGCDALPVQDATNTSSIPASLYDSTAGVYLGAYEVFAATANNVYAGEMDEVRIWAEDHNFTNDHDCAPPLSTTNLRAGWSLDNVLTDYSGNSNTLTNNNSVAFTTDVPFTADCSIQDFFIIRDGSFNVLGDPVIIR